MKIENQNYFKRLIEGTEGEEILDRILVLEDPNVIKSEYYHSGERDKRMRFEKVVKYDRGAFLAIQMEDKSKPWTIVPGRILKYKGKTNPYGVPITTVALIDSEENINGLKNVLMLEGFRGNFVFWDPNSSIYKDRNPKNEH